MTHQIHLFGFGWGCAAGGGDRGRTQRSILLQQSTLVQAILPRRVGRTSSGRRRILRWAGVRWIGVFCYFDQVTWKTACCQTILYLVGDVHYEIVIALLSITFLSTTGELQTCIFCTQHLFLLISDADFQVQRINILFIGQLKQRLDSNSE